MKILKVVEILELLENAIVFNLPFSHIRFGDGGLKFIHSILFRDIKQLDIIVKKEGLPIYRIVEIFEKWGYYARKANCIDTPEVYFNGKFWPRVKKSGKPINSETEIKMRMWRELYHRSEFDNNIFCNPESNYLMILNNLKTNLFDIMENRKICIITAKPKVKNVLSNYNIDIVPIVGQWQNHYEKCYKKVMKCITSTAPRYDFWLVAAGELGRIYTGRIKECGGRAIDIGFVIEYWLSNKLHSRLEEYIVPSLNNKLELTLTNEGKRYEKFI